jgi:hypothetical protein
MNANRREEEARRKVLELAVHHGWTDARILASTGRSGHCAIALAYRPDGKAAMFARTPARTAPGSRKP